MNQNVNDVDVLVAVYADDEAVCGNELMEELMAKTKEKFETKSLGLHALDVFRTHLKTLKKRLYSIDQKSYIEHLQLLSMDCSFDDFCSRRASLAWIGLTCPDLFYGINSCSQASDGQFGKERITEYTYAVRLALKTSNLSLRCGPLTTAGLHLRVYVNASFANNMDL